VAQQGELEAPKKGARAGNEMKQVGAKYHCFGRLLAFRRALEGKVLGQTLSVRQQTPYTQGPH